MIIPEIFHTLYEVKSTQKSEDVDMVLLREPKDSGYYEFSANDELVITKGHNNFTPKEEAFQADTVDGYVKKILKQLKKAYEIELRS